MRRISVEQRRARLGRAHRLSHKAANVVDVVHDLLVLHATDPATVFLSAQARLQRPKDAVPQLERALYDDQSLVKLLAMRRTLFVVAAEAVPDVRAGAAQAIAARERRRLVNDVEQQGIATNGSRWLAKAEADVIALLEQKGELFAADITRAIPALQAKLAYGEGKKWGGETGVGPRVLTVLGAGGRIVRGRPRGPWPTSVHRYALVPDATLPDAATARAGLARRWLAAYGPATVADLKWWTGWSLGDTRKALAVLGDEVEPVELEGSGEGIMLAGTTIPTKSKPWVALLPGLDATVMGWADRDWYLDPRHKPHVTDRSGNVGPTVWVDGRVVGAWAQRKKTGEIVHRLLEDVPARTEQAIAAAAEQLQKWLGDVVVTPRFPAPLDRELSAGVS